MCRLATQVCGNKANLFQLWRQPSEVWRRQVKNFSFDRQKIWPIDPADRRRLDLVIYGATPLGGALCCDATLVSPLTCTWPPQPCAAATDGAALRMAAQRKRMQARRVPGTQHGRRAAAGGPGHGCRGPLERGSVALCARSGPGQGPARPARPANCCQGRLVAKVGVPVGSLSATGHCCHSIGQYVVGAGLRQPGAWPRARVLNLAESSGPSRLPLR